MNKYFFVKDIHFVWKNYLGQLTRGKCMGVIIGVIIRGRIIQVPPFARGPIFLGAIVWRNNCPWGATIQGAIVLEPIITHDKQK